MADVLQFRTSTKALANTAFSGSSAQNATATGGRSERTLANAGNEATSPSILNSGGGGGTSGGMDAWQTSVEKRLDSLDRRAGALEVGVSDLRERAGRIETKVDHLPGKGFVVTVVLTALTMLSLLVAIITNLGRIAH